LAFFLPALVVVFLVLFLQERKHGLVYYKK
jgi:hypothetical protein